MLSPSSENGYEEVSRVAATLYLEMKRCIKVGNLKAFREAVTVVREIIKRNDIPGSNQNDLIERLAVIKDTNNRNVLHDAAALAVANDDARYFNALLDIGFPMYDIDSNGDFAPFIIANIRGDGVFQEAFRALLKAGFDVGRPNEKRLTFIQKLCESNHVTVQKMQALIQTKPSITPEMVSHLVMARVESTSKKTN